MAREIALIALVALDYPVRRATARATRAAGHRPMNVTERSGRDFRHGDAR